MKPISLRLLAATVAAAALLAACGSPQFIKPGETEAEVLSGAGRPTLQFPRPDGGKRLIYTGQPMGQFAWVTDIDARGIVTASFQTLTDQRFDMLDQGSWDTKRLLYEFGPPAIIDRVGLHAEQIVWNYRYRQSGVWNSLMYVYVTEAGEVYRHNAGPDPMYEGKGRR